MPDTIASLSTNPTLRNFAQDHAQQGIKEVANFIAPTVEVPSLVGQYKVWSAKHRYKRPNTLRNPIEGRATRIGFDVNDATYRLQPHALDFQISDYEKMETDQLLATMQYGAGLTADAANLDHEIEVINLAVANVGAGTNVNFAANGFDVIKYFDERLKAATLLAKNGAPLRIVMGLDAWLIIKNHSSVKAAFNGVKNSYKIPSIEQFIAMLALPVEIMLSNIVQDSAAEGLAEDVDFAMSNEIIFFPCNGRPNTMDASWMKTFRLAGKFMVPGAYESEDKRDQFLKLDWTHQVLETNSGSAIRINATVS